MIRFITTQTIIALILAFGSIAATFAESPDTDRTLAIVVMDPLAAPLSCACLNGVGQRRYDLLEPWLAKKLNRKLEVVYAESLALAVNRLGRQPDLVFGQQSVVEFDAVIAETNLRLIAELKDQTGNSKVRGLFVVAKNSPIMSLADLAKRKVVLGPIAHAEAHLSARQALIAAEVADPNIETAFSIEEAVYAVDDGKADATIVPDFLFPLLQACGKIEKGALRTIGKTPAEPFIGLFAHATLPPELVEEIRTALKQVADVPEIAKPMESTGFVLTPLKKEHSAIGWTDWRGPNREGKFAALPDALPEQPEIVWSTAVTGPAMAGISATQKFVVVADKDRELTADIFRCFSAETGRPVWELKYRAAAWLDYTNAPRAQPVIAGNRVFLLGALGDLHCVELATGKIVWKRNLPKEFAAEIPNWGYASTPLLVDGKLIVNPGSAKAAIAALNPATGKTVWQTAGNAAAYAPFIVAELGGRRQLVGYDSGSAGGWDIATGKRLWRLVPPDGSDFNVTTPIVYQKQLLLATENNGVRLYRFEDDGTIVSQPVAHNLDAAPDTCTPAVVGSRTFLNAYGMLYCLDLKAGLKTIWEEEQDAFFDHANIVANNRRLLVWTTTGSLLLLDATANNYTMVSKWLPFQGEIESMSHPAIVGDRLYLRSDKKLICVKLK